jgi:hypothetical protein
MAKRIVRKKKTKAPAKKRKAVKHRKKAAPKGRLSRDDQLNKKAYWAVFKALQKKADLAWEKLRANVKRQAKAEIILKSRNELLLLLGECDYMARECKKVTPKS